MALDFGSPQWTDRAGCLATPLRQCQLSDLARIDRDNRAPPPLLLLLTMRAAGVRSVPLGDAPLASTVTGSWRWCWPRSKTRWGW